MCRSARLGHFRPAIMGTIRPALTLAPGADNTPQQIPVTLTVQEPLPSISSTPTSFTFSCTRSQANPPPQILEVWNSGGATLNWTASEASPWLSFSPTSGSSTGEHDPITLSLDASSLSAATYTATITLSVSTPPENVPLSPVEFVPLSPVENVPLGKDRLQASSQCTPSSGRGFRGLPRRGVTTGGRSSGSALCAKIDPRQFPSRNRRRK